MPKIYDDTTLRMVWKDVHVNNKMLRDICKELNIDMAKANQMYQAAYRRFGCNQYNNRNQAISMKKKKIIPASDVIKAPVDRKSFTKYSNTQWHEIPDGTQLKTGL